MWNTQDRRALAWSMGNCAKSSPRTWSTSQPIFLAVILYVQSINLALEQVSL